MRSTSGRGYLVGSVGGNRLREKITCVGRLICPEGHVLSLNKSNPTNIKWASWRPNRGPKWGSNIGYFGGTKMAIAFLKIKISKKIKSININIKSWLLKPSMFGVWAQLWFTGMTGVLRPSGPSGPLGDIAVTGASGSLQPTGPPDSLWSCRPQPVSFTPDSRPQWSTLVNSHNWCTQAIRSIKHLVILGW